MPGRISHVVDARRIEPEGLPGVVARGVDARAQAQPVLVERSVHDPHGSAGQVVIVEPGVDALLVAVPDEVLPQLGALGQLAGQRLGLLRIQVVVAQPLAEEAVQIGVVVAHGRSIWSNSLRGLVRATASSTAAPRSVSARPSGSGLMTGISVPSTICSTPYVAMPHSSASRPQEAVSMYRLRSIVRVSPLNARQRSSRNGAAPAMIAKHTRRPGQRDAPRVRQPKNARIDRPG